LHDAAAQSADGAAIFFFLGTFVRRPTSPFTLIWHRNGIGFRRTSGSRDFLEIDDDFVKSFFLSGLNRELIEPENC
jgi:hypothetical protein